MNMNGVPRPRFSWLKKQFPGCSERELNEIQERIIRHQQVGGLGMEAAASIVRQERDRKQQIEQHGERAHGDLRL